MTRAFPLRPHRPHQARPGEEEPSTERGRTIARPVRLPTGRAVLGGLLVALSGLGILAAHRAVTIPDETNWLVLRRPVAPGSRLVADDLALAPMTLATGTRRRAIADPGDAIGRVALVPLAPGDLLLRSATADAVDPTDATARRVGLALAPADALGGDLAVGDRVDVVAVPAADGSAEVIVHGALVTHLDGGDGEAVGGIDAVGLILDVPDEQAAQRVIEAHARDGVTLIAASTITLDGGSTDG